MGTGKLFFEWHKYNQREARPTKWHYWPVSFRWVRNSCHAVICWHGWPMDGSPQYPDATATDCGWTVHIGAIKIRFGKRNHN
jgi:hypothetical protein